MDNLLKLMQISFAMQTQKRCCEPGIIENDSPLSEARMSNRFLSNVKQIT